MIDPALSTAQSLVAALAAFKSAAQAVDAGKSSPERLAGHLVELERHVDQLVTDLRSVPGMIPYVTRAELARLLEAATSTSTVQEAVARRLKRRIEHAQGLATGLQTTLERASEPPWKSARAAIQEGQQEVFALQRALRGESP